MLEWKPVVAVLLNGAVVMVVIQLLKYFVPILKKTSPWVLRTIVLIAPFVLGELARLAAAWLGVPIDFGPIINALSGIGALTAFHVSRAFVGKGGAF